MYPPGYRDDDDDCGCSPWRTVCAYHREQEQRERERPFDPKRDRQVTDEEVAATFAAIGASARLSDIPDDCPDCGLTMVVRHGPHGAFLGCCMFPKCRGSRSI